ncbi:hypothetical protein OIU76_024378 [Salix suchowensis]|nr:hypothetical protein OIU76_024378 [Salix suchowensis]
MRSLHLISRIHKTLNLKNNPNFTLTSSNFTRRFTSPSQESTPSPREPPPSTDRVTSIVDELSKLTLLEVSDLTEVLRTKLEIKEMPVMAVMMPGMGFSMGPGMKGGAVGGSGSGEGGREGGEDSEAKDLVEKAPTLLKKGVTKDEAEKIVEKNEGSRG